VELVASVLIFAVVRRYAQAVVDLALGAEESVAWKPAADSLFKCVQLLEGLLHSSCPESDELRESLEVLHKRLIRADATRTKLALEKLSDHLSSDETTSTVVQCFVKSDEILDNVKKLPFRFFKTCRTIVMQKFEKEFKDKFEKASWNKSLNLPS
jgi:hypothetical protein